MVDRMKAVRLVCSEVRTLRLGCEKNLVDSEYMIGMLNAAGY